MPVSYTITILSATIILGVDGAPDQVYLETELPFAEHPFEGTENVNFPAASGTGESYIQKNFPGLPITIRER